MVILDPPETPGDQATSNSGLRGRRGGI